MSPRARKFIGLICIVAFCIAYVAVVATVGDYIPDHWAVRLVYFAVAGTLWGVPLFPLIRWMNREP